MEHLALGHLVLGHLERHACPLLRRERSGLPAPRTRSTTTTVLGGSMTPTPARSIRGIPPPSLRTAAASRSTSAGALSPFMASISPPGRSSGRLQPASRARGATARAVTTSAPSHRRRTTVSSARPRSTAIDRPRSAMTSWSHSTRRARGSMRTMRRSGRASANGIPGSPAPEPTSTRRAPFGTSSATRAQFRTCRSQTRGASLGPIRPRSTPDVTRCSANRWARGNRSPKTEPATPSLETGVAGTSGTAEDDDLPPRLLALALAGHSLDASDGVVDDLALEGCHRAQPHGLPGREHVLRRAGAELGELLAPRLPPAGDVE